MIKYGILRVVFHKQKRYRADISASVMMDDFFFARNFLRRGYVIPKVNYYVNLILHF